MKIIYVQESVEGHRADYEKLFAEVFARAGVSCQTGSLSFAHIACRAPLFSSMLEEHPLKFFLIALIRAVFCRRSVSITFRPEEAISGNSSRLIIKRLLLKLVRKIPLISIISLIPFETDSTYSSICRDWIYDPQFWDLLYIHEEPNRALSDNILNLANGRKILCAVGRQDETKGFDKFCLLWSDNPEIRRNWLFVAVGSVADGLRAHSKKFCQTGGYLIDRYAADTEIMSLYDVSNVVWCAYAPSYNQSSGVFGRAYQHKKVAIVRERSLLEAMANRIGTPVIPLNWDSYALDLTTSEFNRSSREIQDREVLRDRSLSILSAALGVDIDGPSDENS